MKSHRAKSGVFFLSFALAGAFADSQVWPQTDAFMSQGRSSVDAGTSTPGGDMQTVQPDPNILPGFGLSPLLDLSLVEALQRQQVTQERAMQERAIQQNAVRLEEQRRQGSPKRREFFLDSQ